MFTLQKSFHPVLILILLALTGSICGQAKADSLLQFILKNKDRASLYVIQNDSILARQNENTLMPLASTVKILIAIEFAKQAAGNVIDENTLVALTETDKYYLPLTDGGAHPAWLRYERSINHIHQDSIKLIDIARGMIMFSSNANAEYLLDLLGLDNVNNNTKLFGLTEHTAVFPLVSSLFLYQNPRNAKEASIIKGIKKISEEEYCKTIYQIHNALKYDTVLKKKFRPQDLSINMQQLWSDRLTASSTKRYAQLCSILNNRRFLDANTYGVLAYVLETIMEHPGNQKIYNHFGIKNGSTAFVLTEAFYCTLKDGLKIEAAYFFNNLTIQENSQLQSWLNDFRIALTQNEAFRIKTTLAFKK